MLQPLSFPAEVLHSFQQFPSWIVKSFPFYRQVLSEEELFFFVESNTFHLDPMRMHLFHTQHNIWIPLTLRSEGCLGSICSVAVPWVIAQKVFNHVQPYLQDFKLQECSLPHPTCCTQLLTSYSQWCNSKTLRSFNRSLEQVEVEYLFPTTPLAYAAEWYPYCSLWLDKWEELDTTFQLYRQLVPHFTIGIQTLRYQQHWARLFFIQTPEYIFADPILKSDNSPLNLYNLSCIQLVKYAYQKQVQYLDLGTMLPCKDFLHLQLKNFPMVSSTCTDAVVHQLYPCVSDKPRLFYFVQGKDFSAALQQNLGNTHTLVTIPEYNTVQFSEHFPYYFNLNNACALQHLNFTTEDVILDFNFKIHNMLRQLQHVPQLPLSHETTGTLCVKTATTQFAVATIHCEYPFYIFTRIIPYPVAPLNFPSCWYLNSTAPTGIPLFLVDTLLQWVKTPYLTSIATGNFEVSATYAVMLSTENNACQSSMTQVDSCLLNAKRKLVEQLLEL